MYIDSSGNSISQYKANTSKTSQNTQAGASFSELMSDYQQVDKTEQKDEPSRSSTYKMNTNKGQQQEMDLDEYFSDKPRTGSVNLEDVPLLLPTAHNVEVLSKYSQEQFKGLLQQYNIPSPPSSIEFDDAGQMVLPDDYPYAAELKQAFEENPQVEKALSTTAAIASHYVGIQEGQPFRDEMSTARSQADRDRIIEKYSYLFDDDRPATRVVLSFLEDGSMLVGGKKSAVTGQLAGKVLPE